MWAHQHNYSQLKVWPISQTVPFSKCHGLNGQNGLLATNWCFLYPARRCVSSWAEMFHSFCGEIQLKPSLLLNPLPQPSVRLISCHDRLPAGSTGGTEPVSISFRTIEHCHKNGFSTKLLFCKIAASCNLAPRCSGGVALTIIFQGDANFVGGRIIITIWTFLLHFANDEIMSRQEAV